MRPAFKNVDDYIRKAPSVTQPLLQQLRRAIKAASPTAREMISYAIPFYEYRTTGYAGRMIYFAGYPKHVSVYVVPKKISPKLAKAIAPYRSGRSTLKFPVRTKVPIAAVKQLVKIRMEEIDATLKR